MPPLFIFSLSWGMTYRKVLALAVFVLMCAPFGFSQKILIPFRDKDLWGYADTNGVIQIKPAFDKASFFNYSRPTTEVYRNKKVSLIDTAGNLLFPFSDKFEYLPNKNFMIVQDNKIGIYSLAGKLVIPVAYDALHHTYRYEDYKSLKNKVIVVKNDVFYLVDLTTGETTPISKPTERQFNSSGMGVVAPPASIETTSIPYPQLPGSDFPALAGQKNLVHCETIRMNTKPVFYVFCAWKDREMIGYVGRNGVQFFKD